MWLHRKENRMSAYRADNIGNGMMTVTKDGVTVATLPIIEAIELIEKLTEEERRNENE